MSEEYRDFLKPAAGKDGFKIPKGDACLSCEFLCMGDLGYEWFCEKYGPSEDKTTDADNDVWPLKQQYIKTESDGRIILRCNACKKEN